MITNNKDLDFDNWKMIFKDRNSIVNMDRGMIKFYSLQNYSMDLAGLNSLS